MRSRLGRAKIAAVIVATGAVAFASGVGACASFGISSLTGAVDMCFVFDCTDGIFGGVIDPCSPIFSRPNTPGFIASDSAGDQNGDPVNGRDLFIDCPDQTP